MIVVGATASTATALLLVQAAAHDTVDAGSCSSASLHQNLTDVHERNERSGRNELKDQAAETTFVL